MQLSDGEVSGQHAAVRWSSVDKCWKVCGGFAAQAAGGTALRVGGMHCVHGMLAPQ